MSATRISLDPGVVAQVRRNERLYYLQLLWVTPFVILLQQYVPVLVTRLGASPLLLGMLTSGSALALTVASVLARWVLQIAPAKMRTVIIPVFASRASLMLIPLVLRMPSHQAEALVLVAVFINLIIGIVQVTFFAFLPKVTLTERVATLISRRWTVLGLTMALGTPVMAVILDRLEMPANYTVACLIALGAGVVEVFNFAAVRLLPARTHAPTRQSAFADVRSILRFPPAARYLFVTLAAQLALNAPAPLIPLKLVRVLGATDVEFGWYMTTYWLSLAVMGLLIPGLAGRFGNRRLFAAAGIGIGAQMLLLAVAAGMPLVYLAGAVGGLSAGLFQVTSFGQVVEYAPPEQYESYVSAQLSVASFAIFAAPLIMSVLLSAGLPIAAGLLICSAGNALASTLSFRKK